MAKKKTAKRKKRKAAPPDGRGARPSDPNQFAKWLVEQTADSKFNRKPKPR